VDVAVVAAGGQEPAVRAPGQGLHIIGMVQAADDLGRLEVEDLDLELVSVGVERHLPPVGAKSHDAAVKAQ
jgi:hypothetical protein